MAAIGISSTLQLVGIGGEEERLSGGAGDDLFIYFSALKIILFLGEGDEKVLQPQANHGKILTVRDGYLVCPHCRLNKRLIQVPPDTKAERLRVYCRACKTETMVDMEKGQCFESRSR